MKMVLLTCSRQVATYSNHYEYGSIDALGGLLMLGKGDGSFTVIPGSKSGFLISKAGRALSLIHHNNSAHPLILAANNNGPLEVFEWKTASKIVEAPEGCCLCCIEVEKRKTTKTGILYRRWVLIAIFANSRANKSRRGGRI